jgi:hypothetical protein
MVECRIDRDIAYIQYCLSCINFKIELVKRRISGGFGGFGHYKAVMVRPRNRDYREICRSGIINTGSMLVQQKLV